MSLASVRRSSRLVSAVLLLGALWQLPHRAHLDEICTTLGGEFHDESRHIFTTPTAPAHQDHCAICHWLRWMKPVFTATAVAAVRLDRATGVVLFAAQRLRNPASDQLPARAPPAV
jgi:hypothetical protein